MIVKDIKKNFEDNRGIITDIIVNEANEWHAIKSLEDSKLLILTRGLRGGKDYESDTYKLDEPLLT